MSARRFTDKPDLNPQAVIGLAADHPAMVENRTLFPSTVVTVTADAPDRLLIDGKNNRKIGSTVEKGRFKGYAIYMLSLEERATCPVNCDVRGECYGNGMQMARRHRIGDQEIFFDRLGWEIAELTEANVGLLVRLHVLGDFPSAEYVEFWKDALDNYPNLAAYGYTHLALSSRGGDAIGDAIQAAKNAHPQRFRIRWSSPTALPDGAVVVKAVPSGQRDLDNSIVCPAQTDATACCATCALCWEAPRECIAFIKHGRMSAAAEIESIAAPTRGERFRNVAALDLGKLEFGEIGSVLPRFESRRPQDLLIEDIYQRGLSTKSLNLIRRIATNWNWAKFKPPVCAETPDGLAIIDGQHTAISAAIHPGIEMIPVMIVPAAAVSERAGAFVAHNRDRVAMTAYEIAHAAIAAGDEKMSKLGAALREAGASFPRSVPARGKWKDGEVPNPAEWLAIAGRRGDEAVTRLAKIVVKSGLKPISVNALRAIDMLMFEPEYNDVTDRQILLAVQATPDLDARGRAAAEASGTGRALATAAELYRQASRRRNVA